MSAHYLSRWQGEVGGKRYRGLRDLSAPLSAVLPGVAPGGVPCDGDMERFNGQLKEASEAGRVLLKRKIALLNEVLDGPQPEFAAPKAPLPSPAKPKLVPLSLEKRRELMAKAWKEASV